MIRINLLPAKKKLPKVQAPPGTMWQVWALLWLIGWVGLIGAGWWVLSMKDDETTELRRKTAEATKAAETIKKEIDEEALEESKKALEQLRTAKENLEKKRRTPVYVMWDLANILSDPAMDPSDPPKLDIDEQKLREALARDPRAGVNLRWDPTGLWIHSIVEKNGVLSMEGSAREASDLTEFVRRLRVSGRFGDVTSPDFNREARKGDDAEPRFIDWTIAGVSIRRWK